MRKLALLLVPVWLFCFAAVIQWWLNFSLLHHETWWAGHLGFTGSAIGVVFFFVLGGATVGFAFEKELSE